MGYKGYNYKTLPLVSNIALQYEHWLCMKGLGVGLVNTPRHCPKSNLWD